MKEVNLGKRTIIGIGLVLMVLVTLSPITLANTGDILRQINPIPGGDGRGMAFDGTHLYYTLYGDTNIYEIDVHGNPIATIPTPIVNGIQPKGGPLAWDGSNLWTTNYGTDGDLIQLNPKGTLVSTCNIITTNPGHPALAGLFQSQGPDGLDWTGIQGSELVLSGEGGDVLAPNSVVFMNTSCGIQSWFTATPKFFINGTSGVAYDGKNLWQVYPAGPGGFLPIFDQTNLFGIDTGISFGFSNITAFDYDLAASEDLAYDPVTFAPICALWANDIGIPLGSDLPARSNNITAYEVPCGPKGNISGTKFEDLNTNGVRDQNEIGLAGWNITLNGTTTTGSTVNVTTTTDANGNYNFTDFSSGTYAITEELKSGWVQTAPATGTYTVNITSGSNITGQDFGNFKKGKITGGGYIPALGAPTARATFGIAGQYPDNSTTAQGSVEYQDRGPANLNVKSINITTVATTMDKKKGIITGFAQVNGAGSYYFEVYVEDNGEPGKGADVFKISLPTLPYSNGANLSSGNIQIQN